MDAIEFVRKLGVKHAIDLLGKAYGGSTHARIDYEYYKKDGDDWFRYENDSSLYSEEPYAKEIVELRDLKKIVDAFELVEGCGGLEKSKLKVQGNRLSYKKTSSLWKAIELVEKCNASD